MPDQQNPCKIALVRMLCEKGTVQQNLELTARYIEEAEQRGVDIIGFPEASISGYTDRTSHPEAMLKTDGPEILTLLRMTEGKNLTALAGIVEDNGDEKPFVTHLIARNGKLISIYRKITIIDEDKDSYTPGDTAGIFDHDGLKFGISICSDIGNRQLFAEFGRAGVSIVFELAAPGLYGEQETRDWEGGYRWWENLCREKFSSYASKHNYWIATATQAGRTSDEDFPGGAYLFPPRGERVFTAGTREPGVSYLQIDFSSGTIKELD